MCIIYWLLLHNCCQPLLTHTNTHINRQWLGQWNARAGNVLLRAYQVYSHDLFWFLCRHKRDPLAKEQSTQYSTNPTQHIILNGRHLFMVRHKYLRVQCVCTSLLSVLLSLCILRFSLFVLPFPSVCHHLTTAPQIGCTLFVCLRFLHCGILFRNIHL